MLRALVFDFDGTILDTETAEFRRWQELYRRYGLTLDLASWQQGIGTWDGFDPWAALPAEASDDRQRLAAELQELVKEDVSALDVRPGVRTLLEEARTAGYRLAVASSSGREWVEEWLRNHGLLQFFTALATRDDVVRVKPDPELYSLACRLLEVRPEEALALEDSLNGGLAAVAAGLRLVVVPNDVTDSQPFPPEWHRLDGLEGGLEALLQESVSHRGAGRAGEGGSRL